MKICIIAEGSYPYVFGGVSSWIQTLVTSMPEHEFIIYAIGANEKDKGTYQYTLPENIIEIREVFLNNHSASLTKTGKEYKMNPLQKEGIESIFSDNPPEWEYIFSLFNGGHRVDTIDCLSNSEDLFEVIQEICKKYYPEIPFTEFYWSIRSMLVSIFKILNQSIPVADVYHSVSTGYAGLLGAYAKYRHNKPFVLTEHGIYTREREEELIKSDWVKGALKSIWIQYFYSLSASAYVQADKVITLFNKNKEIQIDIGCLEEKIQIIPNGVSVERRQPLPQKKKEEENIIYIGAIVRVVPIKDIKTMLQSFAIVKRQIPNVVFYIFGPYDEDPAYYEECLQLVSFLDIQDVTFTGLVNIHEYLGMMDMLVLSSISEGQPLAMLEGMSFGIPFVSTDVGCCKELLYGINDGIGSAGYIVPVMNYMQMAHALIKLSHNPELRNAMGKRGKRRVEAFYTKDEFIQAYKIVYENRGYMNGRDWIPIKKING